MPAPPMNARHATHLLALPLLVGLERLAYYGSRSITAMFLIDHLGMGSDVALALFSSISMVGMVAPLAGALIAALFGPYAAMVLGSLLAAAGLLGLAASPESAGPLLVAVAIGQGLYKPGVWTVAAAQLVDRVHARTGLFTALYVAVNVGALIAAPLGTLLMEGFGPATVFGASGAAMALVPLVSIGLWVAGHGQVWPEPDLQRGLTAAAVAVAVLVLASPFWLLVAIAGNTTWTATQTLGMSIASAGMLQSVNPITVVTVGTLASVGWAAAHLLRLRVADVVFLGIALLAGSAGAFAMHPLALGTLGTVGLGAATVALALSEAIAMPIALSRLAGDSHWRIAPVFLALWTFSSGIASYVGQALETLVSPDIALPIAAFATGVGGVLLVALGLAARSVLLPPVDDGEAHAAA